MANVIPWDGKDVVFASEESYLASFLAFWEGKKKNVIEQEGSVFKGKAKPVHICVQCGKGLGCRETVFYHGKPWCLGCKDSFFYNFNARRHKDLDQYLQAMGIKDSEEE